MVYFLWRPELSADKTKYYIHIYYIGISFNKHLLFKFWCSWDLEGTILFLWGNNTDNRKWILKKNARGIIFSTIHRNFRKIYRYIIVWFGFCLQKSRSDRNRTKRECSMKIKVIISFKSSYYILFSMKLNKTVKEIQLNL